MKFLSALAVLGSVSISNAIQHQADIFYHDKKPLGPSMWHFSGDGLTIYSPSGAVLKSHLKKTLCRPYMSWYTGQMIDDCYFFTYASDGHKYVWAGSLGGTHRVEAFDIDSGDYAGYIETCSTPLDLKYHATREEMWLRCADKSSDGEHMGEIDVFSSNSLSVPMDHVYLNDTQRPYGRISVDSAMGNLGYVSVYNAGYITEIDLSTKKVAETYTIDKAHGAYDMTFSPVNRHIYFRTRVCCTCGDATKDTENCSRNGPEDVLIQTGPSASADLQPGVCSGNCEGSPADTIGVAEFDTVNKVFVGEHNIKSGTGFGADPVTSPDGEHILLLPNDGGQNVRVLKANANGMASTFVKDIPVTFKPGEPTKIVVSDFAFVKDSIRNILVLGSHTDNEIVLVDFNDNYKMRRLNLSPGVEESTGGSSRKIEWAVGTNYVWVNGGESKEQYIINISGGISSARVERTLTGVASGDMMFVNNYKRLRDVELMNDIAMDYFAAAGGAGGEGEGSGVTESSAEHMGHEDHEKGGSSVGTAGLVVGCVALLGVIALAAYTVKAPTSSVATERDQFKEDA